MDAHALRHGRHPEFKSKYIKLENNINLNLITHAIPLQIQIEMELKVLGIRLTTN